MIFERRAARAGFGEAEASPALPVPVQRMKLPNQATQVWWLRQLVDQYRGDPLIREKAIDVVFREAGCPPRAKACHALAIADWVQRNVLYVNEGEETFQSPIRTLTCRYGDCDDHTSLICSMLESIGIPSELVGLEWGGQFRHIFPRAKLAGDGGQLVRMPLDSTLRTPVAKLSNPIAILVGQGKSPRVLAL